LDRDRPALNAVSADHDAIHPPLSTSRRCFRRNTSGRFLYPLPICKEFGPWPGLLLQSRRAFSRRNEPSVGYPLGHARAPNQKHRPDLPNPGGLVSPLHRGNHGGHLTITWIPPNLGPLEWNSCRFVGTHVLGCTFGYGGFAVCPADRGSGLVASSERNWLALMDRVLFTPRVGDQCSSRRLLVIRALSLG